MSLDLERLGGLTEPLTRFFYALMVVALLSVLLGAPSSALFFLVVGALAQVLRAAIQELAWQRQDAPAKPAAKPRRPRAAAARPAPRRPRAASAVVVGAPTGPKGRPRSRSVG